MSEQKHAALGASGAHRWMACPGSLRMEAGLPDQTSPYAREGTAAHALAERTLTQLLADKNVTCDVWLDTEIEGVHVTEEMCEAVQIYVDAVWDLYQDAMAVNPDARLYLERKFSLQELNPPAAMFGTADAVIVDGSILHVFDLKYGAGVAVEVTGNPQLRYYALGALLDLEKTVALRGTIFGIVIHVVQPRAAHADGIHRRESIRRLELVEFAAELLAHARATQEPDAPLKAGDWCRFCKASATCPARAEQAMAVARADFRDAALPTLPSPEHLSLEEITQVLTHADLIDAWLKDLRAHVQGRLERGEEVPGWKLVPKRATRKWLSEEATRTFLHEQGYMDEEIEKRELKSPAQIEKVLKESKLKLPEDLVVKQSSGNNLAPSSDPRPAVAAGPQHEFAALPAAGSTSSGADNA